MRNSLTPSRTTRPFLIPSCSSLLSSLGTRIGISSSKRSTPARFWSPCQKRCTFAIPRPPMAREKEETKVSSASSPAKRRAIGIRRANITSHKLIQRAQLLIVFKTPLGFFHGAMTQRKRAVEHGAHESKDRHRENHLEQGETLLRFCCHGFLFLTMRYVRNSTGRSRPASVTRTSKVI